MRTPKIINVITLDWKEFSEEGFNEFRKTFCIMGYYMGDVYEDFYGENGSDTYVLYISKRKLTPEELQKTIPFLELESNDKGIINEAFGSLDFGDE